MHRKAMKEIAGGCGELFEKDGGYNCMRGQALRGLGWISKYITKLTIIW